MIIQLLRGKLQLTNAGELSCFFIGTGSAFSRVNFQNNLLVIKGQDHVLIDCGTSCPYALSTYGANVGEIRNVLVTHSHADHIGGLEEMAFVGMYSTHRKPRMIITDEYKKILWDASLRGGCERSDHKPDGMMTFDDYFEQVAPELLSTTPRPFYHTKVGAIDLKIFRTVHISDASSAPTHTIDWNHIFYSVGVLIDDRILFTADTRFDKPLLDWLLKDFPGIEWIFHDCQFYESGVHATYEQLKTLDATTKEKMYLCHYGDSFESYTPKKEGFAGFAQRGVYYNFG
ncbi:MAG: MBL fold metallo-hydrolase [Treponema sp.]|nr:MBL fold metallo-hydrolase [Treponema sp.]